MTPTLTPELEANPQPLFAPGMIAPSEVAVPKGSSDLPEAADEGFGPNNERLPDKLQQKLKWLVETVTRDDAQPRRMEIKRIEQARDFWKGLQYKYWTPEDGWRIPNGAPSSGGATDLGAASQAPDAPDYMYVTNWFQGYGLAIMAVLSQDIPPTKLHPQSSEQEDDKLAAEEGTKVVQLIQRNNRAEELLTDLAFYAYCDGKIGGYIRYVTDGQRFGYRPEDELEERQVKLGEDSYQCPNPDCGAAVPANEFLGACPNCETPLDEEHLTAAPLTAVPTVKQTRMVPNGAEVLDIIGGLELQTPMWARYQHQFPYIRWNNEVHVARLRAAYRHVADKIKGGASTNDTGKDSTFERNARLGAQAGGTQTSSAETVGQNLVTFSRVWLRPWTFMLLDDDKEAPAAGELSCRDQLLELFPNGCYVVFAGDQYCESRNESMDDCFRVLHVFPGDGQDRPALGTAFISAQERYNILSNLEIETAEHAIPVTVYDAKALDEGFHSAIAEPGTFIPGYRQGQNTMAEAFAEIGVSGPNTDLHRQMMTLSEPVGQFLTGAFPALFGGDSGADTLGQTAIQRDQALGRIGMVWRRVKLFWSDMMLLGVECFRRNRTDDAIAQVIGDDGQLKTEIIHLANLRGNLVAYPETDQQYPTVWSQQQAVLMRLLESQDPVLMELFAHPENLVLMKRLIGLEELVIPDEEARQKQYAEISELLKAQPSEEVVPTADPMFPEGDVTIQVPKVVSSIPIDTEMDNHAVEFEVCARWCNSPRGQDEKRKNPLGFLNVRAHALEHKEVLLQQQAAAEAAAAAEQASPDGGKGGPPANEQTA
jgi:hypothetical protein